jgi:hypothetical protein
MNVARMAGIPEEVCCLLNSETMLANI